MYKKNPINVQDGIPVFSTTDSYISNYEKISVDHTKHSTVEEPNPWISSDIWSEMETSTIELFSSYLKSFQNCNSLNVLDVGVGLGRLLEKICNSNSNIVPYGMDIAIPYLKIAKQKGIDVCFSKIEDMPYKKDSFDFILCTDVLEHVMDLNLCVSKILSVLKKGGILIIRVPYKENLSPYLDYKYPYHLAHLRNFDCSGLKALFTKIFPHKVLDFKPGLYQKRYDWLKYDMPFPLYRKLLFKFLSLLSYFFPGTEKRVVKKLFYPIEMNIVVEKT